MIQWCCPVPSLWSWYRRTGLMENLYLFDGSPFDDDDGSLMMTALWTPGITEHTHCSSGTLPSS